MTSCRCLCYALAALILSACTAGAPVPEDRFYQMELVQGVQRLSEPVLKGGLVVDRVSADPLRSARAVLYRTAEKPLEIKRYRYDFWVEPPPEMIHDALLQGLRDTGIADRVQDASARSPAHYRLTTRLRRFEQLLGSAPGDDQVEFGLEATLYAQAGGTPVWRQDYLRRQDIGKGGMHASARAMEQVLSQVMDQLARDLAGLDLKH